MTFHRGIRLSAAALFIASMTSVPKAVCAQVFSLKPAVLPPSVRLAEVEIRLATGGGGGCFGRCVHYRITVHGAGVVELEDLGTPPRAETKSRSIADTEVVALVNEFLKARFFDALDLYDGPQFVVRKGDELLMRGSGGTGPWVDVTMQLGSATKTVRLKENVPAEVEKLKDLVWRIGGPEAWPVK